MGEPGLGPLAIGALIISLVGLWGTGMTVERESSKPSLIVMDRHKSNCAGMAGFFGCER